MTLHVTPVRFEHHSESLGIGEAAPRLSWVATQAPAGWRQAGYRLQASSGAEVEVTSPDSVLVPWPFKPLCSRDAVGVRVCVVGEDASASDWSDWTEVEAGLLDADDWTASMVGPAGDQAGLLAPLLRGEFDLAGREIAHARVYASAHGVFELELNGRRVGADELAPGWTAYADRLRYATYDVTDHLQPGANVLGAWLGDGWWRGYLGWDGRRELYGSELGLIAQLEVTFADGTRQTYGTGPDWQAGPGPITSADLYNGETFDARAFDPAWTRPGCRSDAWGAVGVQDFDPATLVAPDGPPMRVTETLGVQRVRTSPSGKTILDFGQNLVGRLRIRVTGESGDTITLRHAEVLEHGELATGPLRAAKATDSFTLAGGEHTWAPRFTFHGFRYAEVTGWPGALDPSAIVAEVIGSDLERTGDFRASEPLLEQLHRNIVWGMRGNFLDVPTDCPQRDERLGWTGDLQVFAPTAAFLFDTAGLLSSWLADLAAEQRRYGGTPMVVPAQTTGYSGPMAGWADAATVVPWELYRASGDTEVLRRQFASMASWVDEVTAAAGDDRIWSNGFQFGDWLDPLAPAGRPEQAQTYPEIVATAYFARSSRIVADAARVLGRDADAARYGALAGEVRTAFVREYVAGSGRLLSDSATAYALALEFDLITDADQRSHAADRLAEIVRGNRYRVATGFIGTPLICPALANNGHLDVAYRLLLETGLPSWLYPVKQGATTIWERWDSLLPDGTVNPSGMTSFNHYAFGAIGDWLHRAVAGLDAAEPGYRRLRFAPRPPRTGLTSASASLRTPYGAASTAWTLADGEVRLDVTVPVGASAEVVLPSGAVHVVEHGVHAFAEPFETDATTLPKVDVDTSLGVLMDVEGAMDVLTGVIVKYLPEAAEHVTAGVRGNAGVTPRQIAAMLPHADAVLADLEIGLAALSAGEALPDDFFVLPAPTAAEDDELAEKTALLSGRDFWSTNEGAGVRSLVLSDGPHGVRCQREGTDHLGLNASEPATCFPTGGAIASSWDPALLAEVGAAIGREARALGVDVVLGPAINIKRSPRGGRSFEYLSEDPRLAGELAAAWVEGLQGTGVAASVKHFAVNSQETDRMQVSAEVDARTLRELYLPAFERVITGARPATVMSAYNAVNGVFCSENRWLLTDLLRDEWGFDGLVVSDWGAVKDRVEALKAGLDLEMPGSEGEGTAAILAAVADGRLARADVERAVARLVALAERTASSGVTLADLDEHHRLARRAGAESVVLLRNERAALPLAPGGRVAVLGEFAVRPQFQGGGSSHVNATRLDVPLDELRRALGEESVAYAPGYGAGDAAELLAQASKLASSADTAVVFVGLDEAEQSEGFDRTHLDLPASHVALIEAVAASAPRTVVVLLNGGVVTLEPWHDHVDAIVEAWALGQAVGGALADVLTGAVNPSGRLAETIPVALSDTPSFLTFPGEQLVARHGEGVFVGYRYHATVGRGVRYPFGHGLSYTTFGYSDTAVELTGDDTVRLRVTVRNTGRVEGAEVVQVYVAPAPAAVRRPVRELAGFAKVVLGPGEATEVVLELGRRAFAHWDAPGERWWVAPGTYEVQLGASATDIHHRLPVELKGDRDLPPILSLDSTVKQWFGHLVVGPALMEAMLAGASEEQRAAAEGSADMLKMVESMPMGQFARFPGVDIPDAALEQLIALSAAGRDAG